MTTEADIPPEPGEIIPSEYPVQAMPDGTHSLPWYVVSLALWPFLEQIMSFLVGFVDTALAGHLSVDATNGVGVAGYVLWLMGLLIGAVGVGSTAVIARNVGAQRWRRANQILGQSLTLAAVWGVGLGTIFYFLAPFIAGFSGLRGQSLTLCTEYLRILSLAAPFSTILTISSACLRGTGDTRTPFFVMVLVNIINTTMSVLFVAHWSPLGGHGVRGIAYGTVLAWIAGCLAILLVLASRKRRVRTHLRYMQPRWYSIKRILRVGLPNLMENSGQWVGNFLVVTLVGHLPDTAAIGAHTVAIRVEAISYLPGFAMGTAAATLSGQFLGAGRPDLARRAVMWCWLFGAAIMTTMGIFFIVVPEPFVRIVTDKPEFLSSAPHLLFLTGWVQCGFASYLVLSSALRGAGDTRSAMLITFASTYLVRLPLAYTLGVVYGLGLNGVWIALSIELMVRGILFMLRFLFGRWDRIKV